MRFFFVIYSYMMFRAGGFVFLWILGSWVGLITYTYIVGLGTLVGLFIKSLNHASLSAYRVVAYRVCTAYLSSC